MTTEELLAEMEAHPEMYVDTEDTELVTPVNDVLMVNPETRLIDVPTSEENFGTYNDHDVARKYFKCPRIVQDNIDLSNCNLFINYVSAKGKPGQYQCEDVEATEDGNYITFSWKLTRGVFDANKDATIFFSVQAKKVNGGNVFNTRKAQGKSYETVDATEQIAEEYADIILQLIAKIEAVENNGGQVSDEKIAEAVEVYLTEHPILSIEVDDTLKEKGKAADAKKVGDELGSLKETIEEHMTNHPSGGGLIFEDVEENEIFTSVDEIKELVSITAAFTPTGDIYKGSSLDSLKQYLTVTATYSDESVKTVTNYTLSGTLTNETNTITVTYIDKQTTFTVEAIEKPEVPVDPELPSDDMPNAYIKDGYMYANPINIPVNSFIIQDSTDKDHVVVRTTISVACLSFEGENIFNNVIPFVTDTSLDDFKNGITHRELDTCYMIKGGIVYIRFPIEQYNNANNDLSVMLKNMFVRLPIKLRDGYTSYEITDEIIDGIIGMSGGELNEISGKYEGRLQLPDGGVGVVLLDNGVNSLTGIFNINTNAGNYEGNDFWYINATVRLNFKIPQEKLETCTVDTLKQYLKDNRLIFWF